MISLDRHLSVRTKLLIFLCVVSLAPLLLSSHVINRLGGSSFRQLLDLQVRDGLDQVERSFSIFEERLQSEVSGVAHWDDLSNYFRTGDPDWIRANLENWVPQNYNLDYFALCSPQGEVLHRWSATGESYEGLSDPLFDQSNEKQSGWLSTPKDLFLLAKNDILDGERQLGTLVFGRRLTHRFLLDVKTDNDSNLLIYYGGRLLATTDTVTSLPMVDPSTIFAEMVSRNGHYSFEVPDQNRIVGFRNLKNLAGTEIATLGVSANQSPAMFIQEAVQDILYNFGIPLLVLVLLAALILGLWIEKPIRALSQTMEAIRRTGNLSRRAPTVGGGEISTMSNTFNQMLEQLKKQHEELMTFQTMILTMKEGVLIEDANHKIIYMNPRMEEMLGISGDEGYQESELELDRMITTKGQRITDDRGFFTDEVEWIKPNGRRIQAIKTTGRIEEEEKSNYQILSTFVDVTERNELEIELIEASRMAFLGLFSQGVLHNISNPINSILGFSSLLCKKNENAEIPQRIHTEAMRITEQVSVLGRRWHRTGTRKEELLNLNEIIRDELKFLEADLFYKHNVEKQFKLNPNLPGIYGSYGDFSHALINIIINSLEALQDSPIHKITITTDYTDKEIRLEIEDSGVGIPEEIQKKIFLPFFSTKRRDSKDGILTGAGLGLAITRKVLEPYNVSFEIHSNVGEGTLMVLHIPLKNTRTIKAEVEHNARVQI